MSRLVVTVTESDIRGVTNAEEALIRSVARAMELPEEDVSMSPWWVDVRDVNDLAENQVIETKVTLPRASSEAINDFLHQDKRYLDGKCIYGNPFSFEIDIETERIEFNQEESV